MTQSHQLPQLISLQPLHHHNPPSIQLSPLKEVTDVGCYDSHNNNNTRYHTIIILPRSDGLGCSSASMNDHIIIKQWYNME